MLPVCDFMSDKVTSFASVMENFVDLIHIYKFDTSILVVLCTLNVKLTAVLS